MLKQISIFTGSADLEQALGLLMRTAQALPRTQDNRSPLEELADYYGSPEGHSAIVALARRLGVDESRLPGIAETGQMFRDELLSRRALKLHRGRNVYSAGKARLWECLWEPFRDLLTPDDKTLDLTAKLVSMKTHKGGEDVERCVNFLQHQLEALGFEVTLFKQIGHSPLIMARRGPRGLPGQVLMYGHYDAEDPEPAQWNTDPWTMTERDGRLYGVGIGDNKATLAHRLVMLEQMDETPELVWFIQGEEEIGSPLGHRLMPELMAPFHPDLYLEENGYFDLDGTQRMLARTIGPKTDSSEPPDARLWTLIERLGADAAAFGLEHRLECRGLNKGFFAEGCPFNNAIPNRGRYVAIGVNDPASNIHAPNESVPMWTFAIHRRQFRSVMAWTGRESVS